MLSFLDRILGKRKKSCKHGSCQCAKSLKSLQGKGLRFEPLEARQLLSVSPQIIDNGDAQHYQETGPD